MCRVSIDELLKSVWLPLAFLVYLLVTCCLTVLASHHKKVIDIHERARLSREMRRKYLESMRNSGRRMAD